MDRIQFRRDSLENWNFNNPILLEGEIGVVLEDKNKFKIGDGEHSWNDLPFRGYNGGFEPGIGSGELSVMSQKAVSELVGLSDYPIFSQSTQYHTGNVVIYEGILYEFTENYKGIWDPTKVKPTSLSKDVLHKEAIVQEMGQATNKVISQKVITNEIINFNRTFDGGRADSVYGGATVINCGDANNVII